jgi:hypothetical protein
MFPEPALTCTLHFPYVCYMWHAAGASVGWGTAPQLGRSRVLFPTVSLGFFISIIIPAALLPWGRLSL